MGIPNRTRSCRGRRFPGACGPAAPFGSNVLCGWVAYALDNRDVRYPPHLLVAQRFVYRQIMYWVVVRAIASAIGGWVVGWGKLERTGRVAVTQPGIPSGA